MSSSGEKTGDSSVEKLCEIFSKIIDESKATAEPSKHALEPNPVRLSGPSNYISWARHAKLILSANDYDYLLAANENIILGKDGATKKQINDKVLVWMLGSMEPPIR